MSSNNPRSLKNAAKKARADKKGSEDAKKAARVGTSGHATKADRKDIAKAKKHKAGTVAGSIAPAGPIVKGEPNTTAKAPAVMDAPKGKTTRDLPQIVPNVTTSVAVAPDADSKAATAPQTAGSTPAVSTPAPKPSGAVVIIKSLSKKIEDGYAKMDDLLERYEAEVKKVVRLEMQVEALSSQPVTV